MYSCIQEVLLLKCRLKKERNVINVTTDPTKDAENISTANEVSYLLTGWRQWKV